MALQHLLRTSDLGPVDVAHLLFHAAGYREEPGRDADLLAGRTVLHYFAKPSTRTRLSLQSAVARLGGTPLVANGAELQLERGETIADTARVVSRYVAAVTIRTFADTDVADFAAAASVPVVNALTDGHHPLQSLADLMTLEQRFGSLEGLRLAYLGDANNVCVSLVQACALAGVSVAVAAPAAHALDPAVLGWAQQAAATTGASVVVTEDPREAVAGAHALYTDVWVSMGDDEADRAARMRALDPYRVTGALLAAADPDAVFLHCLPAHRGEEVEAGVIDGPRSVVLDQAENRMWTSMAVLAALLRGRLGGR